MKHPMYPRAKVPQHAAVLALLVTLMNPPLASAAPPTASKCKLLTVAQIPIDLQHFRPAISAAIDGHAANMIVDTGASNSSMFRSAATAFGLKVVENGRKYYAAGGIEYSGQVVVHDFDLAGFVVHNLILTAMGHDKTSGTYPASLAKISYPTGTRSLIPRRE